MIYFILHFCNLRPIHTYTQHGARNTQHTARSTQHGSIIHPSTYRSCVRNCAWSNILFSIGKLKFALLGNFHPCSVLRAAYKYELAFKLEIVNKINKFIGRSRLFFFQLEFQFINFSYLLDFQNQFIEQSINNLLNLQ